MKHFSLVLVLVLASLGVAYKLSPPPDTTKESNFTGGQTVGVEQAVSDRDIEADSPRKMFSSNRHMLFNRGGLVRFATYSFHESGVDFYTRETVDSGRYSWEKSVTTPYLIETIACRTAEDIYVASLDSLTNDIVIERWSYTPASGSLASSHSRFPGTFGQPQPLEATTVSVVGDTFIPPKDRDLPQPNKQTIYRGSDFLGVKSMSVDPEGRFLLVQDSVTFEVFQLAFGQSPNKIVDAQDFPELNKSFRLAPAYQLGTLDRVFALLGSPNFGAEVLVFHDSDNDGNLEPPVLLTRMEFIDAYPDELSNPNNYWEY